MRATTPTDPASRTVDPTASRLRRGLLALAALGTLTTTVELAFLRHWDNLLELVPWVSLAVVATGIIPLVHGATARRVVWARIVAVVTGVVAIAGVAVHVWSNYESAPLDYRHTASWPTTAEPIRWLLAFTDTVGPTPSLAPSALAFVCVCLFLATVGHPALAGAPSQDLLTAEASHSE